MKGNYLLKLQPLSFIHIGIRAFQRVLRKTIDDIISSMWQPCWYQTLIVPKYISWPTLNFTLFKRLTSCANEKLAWIWN